MKSKLDRVIGKILKRLKELFHICDHHWVQIESGTCDYQEGRWGWGYQRYWVDRCTKCGKISREQTHWPIDVDSID